MKQPILVRALSVLISLALLLPPVLPLFAPAAPAHAQTSTTGLIAYVGSDGNVWLTRIDAGEPRQVTRDAGPQVSYGNLKWSPQGTHLAFVRNEHNASRSFMTLALDSFELSTWISDMGGEFDWSPDERRIVYTGPTNADGLLVYDMQSGKTSQVVKPQYGNPLSNPSWSPDGKYLLFAETKIANEDVGYFVRLAVVDLTHSGPYTLQSDKMQVSCDWSPNEDKIACLLWSGSPFIGMVGPCPITILDSDLSPIRQLPTQDDSCDFSPRWSPDGRFITVQTLVGDPMVTKQKNYADILALDGSERIRLGEVTPLDWSPDSRQLVALDTRESEYDKDAAPMIIVVDALTGGVVSQIARGTDAAWQPAAPLTLTQARLDEKQSLIQALSHLTVDTLGLELPGLEVSVLKSYDEREAQRLLDAIATALDNSTLTPQSANGFDRLVIFEGALQGLARVNARATHDTTRSIICIVGVTTQLLQTVQHFRNIIKGVPFVGNVIEQLLRKIEEKAMDILSGFLDLMANTIPDPIIRDGAQRAADLIDQAIRLRVDQGQSLVEALLEGVGVVVGDQALIASFVISTQPALDVAVDTAAASLEPAGTSAEAQQRTQAVVETQQTQGEAAHQTYEDMTATADIAKLIGSIADLTSAVVSPSGVGTVVAQIFSSVAKAMAIGAYGHAAVTNFDVLVDTGQAVYSAEQLAFDPGSAALTLSPSSATELVPIANRSVNQGFVAAQRAQIDQSADEYRAVLNQIVQAVDANQSATVSSLIPLLLAADRAFTTQAKVSIAATGSEQPATAQAQTALYAARVQFDTDSAGLYGLLISYLIEPDNLTNRTQLIEQSQGTAKTIETYASAMPVPTPPNAGQIPAPTVVVAAFTWPERVIAGQPFDLSIELVNAGPTPAIDAYARVRSSGIVTTDQVLMFDNLSGTGSVTRTLTLRAGETGQAVLSIDALTIAGQTDTSRLVINVEPADSSLPTGLPISPIGLGVALGVIIVIGLTAIFIVRRRSKAKN